MKTVWIRGTHKGYWLRPDWVKGWSWHGASIACSRSMALHNSASTQGEQYITGRRYGFTVGLCGFVVAVYGERHVGRQRIPAATSEYAVADSAKKDA